MRLARLRIGLACIALAVGAAVSCVDFGSLQVSENVAEGGSPSVDAESGVDGTSVADAGADASWCATQPPHWFCADFDEVGGPEVGWTKSNVGGGGVPIAHDLSVSVSAPASARSAVTNGSAKGGSYAVLIKSVSPHPASMTVGFDILTSAPTGEAYDGGATLFAIQDLATVDGAMTYGVTLDVPGGAPGLNVNTSYLGDGGFAEFFASVQALATDWTRVVVALDFGPPERVRVSFNGAVQLDHVIDGSRATPNIELRVSLGVVAKSGGPLHANYDNVTIDVE
ncbi:MAG: hypothetical protein JWP87_3342 [Labilithrix sp.]|nr:hypothetical protein [Labilithrix sp.]